MYTFVLEWRATAQFSRLGNLGGCDCLQQPPASAETPGSVAPRVGQVEQEVPLALRHQPCLGLPLPPVGSCMLETVKCPPHRPQDGVLSTVAGAEAAPFPEVALTGSHLEVVCALRPQKAEPTAAGATSEEGLIFFQIKVRPVRVSV